MPPDELYPRWYLSLRGFVWGLTIGVAAAMTLYELRVWSVENQWQGWYMPYLLYFAPAVFLSLFEIVFRVRRHLRLQRRVGVPPTAA